MAYLIALLLGIMIYLIIIEKLQQKDKIPFTDLLSKL